MHVQLQGVFITDSQLSVHLYLCWYVGWYTTTKTTTMGVFFMCCILDQVICHQRTTIKLTFRAVVLPCTTISIPMCTPNIYSTGDMINAINV